MSPARKSTKPPRQAHNRDARTERYQIRYTPEDRDAWADAAKVLRVDVSDLIRMAMAEKLGARVSIVPTGATVDVNYKVAAAPPPAPPAPPALGY